jgi:hypothetical protein
MNALVERDRQLAGNPHASNTRSQLALNANQEAMATDQLHIQGTASQRGHYTYRQWLLLFNELTKPCENELTFDAVYVFFFSFGFHR